MFTETLGPRAIDYEESDGLLEAVEAMEHAGDDGEVALAHARGVLAIDPACVPAIVVLAENSSTPVERIALFKEAISAWRRSFRPAGFDSSEWWKPPVTRTVMAAIAGLGDALEEVGDQDGAAACFKALMDLDPENRFMAAEELERIRMMVGSRRP